MEIYKGREYKVCPTGEYGSIGIYILIPAKHVLVATLYHVDEPWYSVDFEIPGLKEDIIEFVLNELTERNRVIDKELAEELGE